jgi:magnesium transporter
MALTAARTRLYRDGKLELEGFPAADISEYLADESVTIWLDLRDPDPNHDDLAVLSEEFGLHPVAVEAALQHSRRPKLARYRDYLFLTAYAARLDAVSGELATSGVAAFITSQALITIRQDDGLDIDAVVQRWDETANLAKFGVGYLLYGLLDYIVDSQSEAVQSLDDCMEELEDRLFDGVPRGLEVQRRVFALRKSLVLLRRIVFPMSEIVGELMRRDLRIVGDDLMPYYQDVYDEALHAAERTDSLRDRDHPGQPVERHHQEGHRLGRDHRRPHVHYRILRDERALSRLRRQSWPGRLRRRHGRDRAGALPRLQAQGLAVRP